MQRIILPIWNYSISGGNDAEFLSLDAETGELNFNTPPDFGTPKDANNDNIYELTVHVFDDQGFGSSKNLFISVTDNPSSTGINFRARALLQGAYVADTGLMHSKLRDADLLPVNQPYSYAPFNYTGTEQINPGLAVMLGNDALVDWVLLELRAINNPQQAAFSKAAHDSKRW